MDTKTASMAIQLLQRAQISGAEVPAFLAVINALNAIMRGDAVVPATQEQSGGAPT